MDRIFIDEETGEDLIHPFDDYDFHCLNDSTMTNDAETGEPEVNIMNHTIVRGHLRKAPFQVFKKHSITFQLQILQFKKTQDVCSVFTSPSQLHNEYINTVIKLIYVNI